MMRRLQGTLTLAARTAASQRARLSTHAYPTFNRRFRKLDKWALAAVGGGALYAALSPGRGAAEAKAEEADHDKEHHRARIVADIDVDHEWDPSRYGAYAFLIGRLTRGVRYLAYSSDVGEAMRPVVPTWLVNATYGIAIGYCALDVGFEGYKEHKAQGDVKRAVVKQTLFQGLASIGLPFLIIHTSVHGAQKLIKSYAPKHLKWGPTVFGLLLIPFLPTVCDVPVEHGIEWAFDEYWPKKGGEEEKKHH
mmetsp:Transcript_1583/g.3810  ORF Transcript_1583/g.3810 Transcript_1583/m.3810 type:complete len:250 (-) Transcript_1583:9-758(-)